MLGGDGRWSPGTGTARERVALAFLYWRPSAVIAEKLWTWKCASNGHAVDLANLESTKQADKVFVPAPGRHNCQNRNTEPKTGDASEEREQQQPTDTKRPSGDSAPNPPTLSYHRGLTLCLYPVTSPGSENSFFFFFFLIWDANKHMKVSNQHSLTSVTNKICCLWAWTTKPQNSLSLESKLLSDTLLAEHLKNWSSCTWEGWGKLEVKVPLPESTSDSEWLTASVRDLRNHTGNWKITLSPHLVQARVVLVSQLHLSISKTALQGVSYGCCSFCRICLQSTGSHPWKSAPADIAKRRGSVMSFLNP